MAGTFTRTAAGRGLAQIRHIEPVQPAAADGLVARVYDQVERDFGMLAPPVGLHSPAPGPLAASWVILRETLVAAGEVGRPVKEAVAAAVSLGNACPYCVDVHTATLHGLVDDGEAQAIVAGRIDAIADPDLRQIAEWARSGWRRESSALLPLPVAPAQVPQLVGVAATFHYFNRMVHVFLPDSPIPPVVPGAARGGFWRLLGRFMWRAARASHEPGAALDLLPAAPLPRDLAWAAGSTTVADAFARASAAVEAAGERSVPAPVRELVAAELAGWNGRLPGIGRSWVADLLGGIPPADRPAGRLALLTAFAPYQLDDAVVERFRRDQPADAALVELTSWASMAAARRIGSWLAEDVLVGLGAGRQESEPPAA